VRRTLAAHTLLELLPDDWRERLSYEHRIGRSKKDDYGRVRLTIESTIGDATPAEQPDWDSKELMVCCCLTYSYADDDSAKRLPSSNCGKRCKTSWASN